jgi:integrase
MAQRKSKPRSQAVRPKGIKSTAAVGKPEPRPLQVLTPEEINEVLGLISSRSTSGIRNLACLGLMYGAGLRVSEALAVRKSDLDLDGLQVRVGNGKGGKARTVGLLPAARPWIERWIDRRDHLVEKSLKKARRLEDEGDEQGAADERARAQALRRGFRSGPLICTYTVGQIVQGGGFIKKGDERDVGDAEPGSPVSDRYVRTWLAKLRDKALEAGITEKEHAFHPHAWRHAHADSLRRLGGWDTVKIQKQLGHADTAITGHYLDHIGANELGESMRGQDWGVGEKPEQEPESAEDRIARLEQMVQTLMGQVGQQVSKVQPQGEIPTTTTRRGRGKARHYPVDSRAKKS